MSIFIPLWVFYGLAVYYGVGLVLYVPLVYWHNKFISGNLGPFHHIRFIRVLTGLFLASGLCWPYMVYLGLRNEWRYGIFKMGW
jgi:hypothetical protein